MAAIPGKLPPVHRLNHPCRAALGLYILLGSMGGFIANGGHGAGSDGGPGIAVEADADVESVADSQGIVEAPLHLNEIAAVRAGLLSGLFAHAPVTRHNAEAIADYLPSLRPTVVLMNPPFSASPGVQRNRHDADLRHLRSAFSMLPAGGRLVAITSAGCIPGDAAWSRAFERLDPPPRTVFSITIDGHAYARRGTTFDTRLTVIDRDPANAQGVPVDARESVPTAAGLLAAIAANVPQRQAVVPIAAALVPAGDLFGHAAARPAPRKRATATASRVNSAAPQVRDWGPVAELDYETSPANPEDENGKPLVFRDSLIENIRELVDVVPRLNIFADDDLAMLCREVKDKFAGIEPDSLRPSGRFDPNLRRQVKRDADALKAQFAGYFAPAAADGHIPNREAA